MSIVVAGRSSGRRDGRPSGRLHSSPRGSPALFAARLSAGDSLWTACARSCSRPDERARCPQRCPVALAPGSLLVYTRRFRSSPRGRARRCVRCRDGLLPAPARRRRPAELGAPRHSRTGGERHLLPRPRPPHELSATRARAIPPTIPWPPRHLEITQVGRPRGTETFCVNKKRDWRQSAGAPLGAAGALVRPRTASRARCPQRVRGAEPRGEEWSRPSRRSAAEPRGKEWPSARRQQCIASPRSELSATRARASAPTIPWPPRHLEISQVGAPTWGPKLFCVNKKKDWRQSAGAAGALVRPRTASRARCPQRVPGAEPRGEEWSRPSRRSMQPSLAAKPAAEPRGETCSRTSRRDVQPSLEARRAAEPRGEARSRPSRQTPSSRRNEMRAWRTDRLLDGIQRSGAPIERLTSSFSSIDDGHVVFSRHVSRRTRTRTDVPALIARCGDERRALAGDHRCRVESRVRRRVRGSGRILRSQISS